MPHNELPLELAVLYRSLRMPYALLRYMAVPHLATDKCMAKLHRHAVHSADNTIGTRLTLTPILVNCTVL
jgi:hypothetical protein